MSTISQQVTPLEDPHANDELLTIAEVADVLRVPVATLRYWRHLGTGPHSFRIGRGVRNWRSEVSAWLHGQSNGPNRRMSPGQVSSSGELDTWPRHHRDVACLGSTKARRGTTSRSSGRLRRRRRLYWRPRSTAGRIHDRHWRVKVMASIERLGQGRWRARWRDPSGRQKAKTFTHKNLADKYLQGVGMAMQTSTLR
jgi:Helix-turn-helix domain